ncbi:MAG: ABC transporter permease, partial [Halobacteria archaeon]|nr:ABC transporter permease [Halobacteria archaeon]
MTRVSFSYLMKRIAASIFVIWAILTLLFILLKAMPGDMASLFLNPQMESSDLRNLRERFGLNEPLWIQYLKWLRSYATFNFGMSMRNLEPVSAILARRLPRTIALLFTAFIMNYTIGIITGIHFGWSRGTKMDKSGFVSGLTLYSIPYFWLAWLLIL